MREGTDYLRKPATGSGQETTVHAGLLSASLHREVIQSEHKQVNSSRELFSKGKIGKIQPFTE